MVYSKAMATRTARWIIAGRNGLGPITETGTRHHVNGVESFWHLFKASVASTHIHISEKYMDRYLGEFQFRSNHREMRNAMFDFLIAAL